MTAPSAKLLPLHWLRRLATYLPLAALALLAAWPLFRYGPPLPVHGTSDGPNHLYRFVELDRHVRHGDFYPRWFADLHFGFGSPLPNFYSPLSYYILLALRLFTSSFPTTFLLGFVLAIAAGALGMFAWTRDQFHSPPAGLTAAAAYCLTPYYYYRILDSGAYPELWGLAVAPWLFWLVLRMARRPSRGVRAGLTLLYAALILTHNPSALLFTPILVIYGLAAFWQAPDKQGRPATKTLALFGMSLAHAAGLSAFFLLPFLLENSYVQLQRASAYDYKASFVPLHELFSPPVPFDPYRVVNFRPVSLPWPQIGLALAAFGSIAYLRRKNRAPALAVAVNGLLLVALTFLTHHSSAGLWKAFPLASFVQFPSRLLGPATLLLAWLAGAGIAYLPVSALRPPVALVSVAAFFFFSLTWTFHEPYSRFPDTILPADIIRDEIANPTRIGATNLQEFLPRWVSELPPADTLLPRYSKDLIPSRLAALPPDVILIRELTALTATDLTYAASEPVTLTFDIFYFPGWTATLDDRRVPIVISSPHGLITLDLPRGRHDVRLALLPTGPQVMGSLISLLALLALFVPFIGRQERQEPARAEGALSPYFALLFAGLLALRVLVLDRVETPFYYSALDKIRSPVSVNFDDQLELVGFDLPGGDRVISGGLLDVRLYWRALTALTTDYQTSIQLVDRYGNRFGQSDNQTPGRVPTSRWNPAQYARDEHRVSVLSGTPPGEYHLLVSAYALIGENGTAPLNIRVNQSPAGVEYDLGPVTVARARPQPPGPLRLVESSLARPSVSGGDELPFTLLWNSGDQPLPELTAHLALTDTDGDPVFSTDFDPGGPDYRTDQWTPNELVRFPEGVDLPPNLPAGPARLALTLLRPDRTPASDTYDLGQIYVSVPQRSFAVPPMAYTLPYDFNETIRLLGYDLAADAITLYWQALRPISTRLTVFVHRFDATGAFVAGQDSAPIRPTTSWLPGEVITDTHPIVVGDHFDVGLYDPVSGARYGKPLSVHSITSPPR